MRKGMKRESFVYINKKKAIPAVAGIAFFLVIAYFIIAMQGTLLFDTVIREFIYSLRSEGLTAFFTAVTYLGNWQTITLICFVFLLIPQMRTSFGIPLCVSAILGTIIQKVLKTSFHRARPDLALHLIQQGGYSFPSGHSFTVLIFYGMLIFLCRQNRKNRTAANFITILLSCLIFLIGFSRIYLGVHYPTDVLGGWSLGLFILMVLITFVTFLQSKN
jgi:Membrane-associated phospholipid phosphatase